MINGKNFHVYRQAKEGVELAMKELNPKTPPPFSLENEPFGNYPMEIHDLADSVLSLGTDRPTALLIDCAPITRTLLHRLQQKGVNGPDDMSIGSWALDRARFRHTLSTNLILLDGHAETRKVALPPNTSPRYFWSGIY